MNVVTVFILLSLPVGLIAVKCTDKPTAQTTTPEPGITDYDSSPDYGTTEEPYDPPTSWPKGRWAMYKAGESCPEFATFKPGFIYQDTEDEGNINYWPDDTMMMGAKKQDGMEMHFCSKTSVDSSESNWPKGNYCILRSTKNCPRGFQKGSIKWDDENNFNKNMFRGKRPKGSYGADVVLEYCCRKDAPAYEPIELPVTTPFYLVKYNSTFCQEVRAMEVTQEDFFWDVEDDDTDSSITGAAPGFIDPAGDIELSFCLYRPYV